MEGIVISNLFLIGHRIWVLVGVKCLLLFYIKYEIE